MTKNSEIEKLIFDFDGVLVDSNQSKRDCFLKVADLYGNEIVQWFEEYCNKHPNESRYGKMEEMKRRLTKADIEVSHQELVNQYSYCVQAALPHANSVRNLTKLKNNKRGRMWSIVSAAPEHEISQYLRKQKWLDLFEDGIYGAPRSKEKIFDEEYNRETLEGSTVFLGDSESDLKVAKLFNIDFIFVKKWSRDPWLADKEGVNYVESVEEFLRKV